MIRGLCQMCCLAFGYSVVEGFAMRTGRSRTRELVLRDTVNQL